jgi:carbon monoxide dehydrogenase subunit G
MRRVEASASIEAPAESIFAFVADLDNLATWQPGVVSAQQTSPGAVEVGATARVLRELMGQRVTVDLEVTDYVAGRRLALASAAGGLTITAAMDLEPHGQATLARVATEIRTRSAFLAPLEGMAARIAEDDMVAGLQRLKDAIEGRVGR